MFVCNFRLCFILDELVVKSDELDSLKKTHDALILSTKDLEAKSEQKISKAYAQIDKTTKKYKSLLEEFNELQKKYREMEAQSEIWRSDLNEERANKVQLRQDHVNEVKELLEEIERLKNQYKHLMHDYESSQKELVSHDEEIEILKEQNNHLSHDYKIAQKELVSHDEEISRLSATVQQLTEELNKLRSRNNGHNITFNATYVTNTNINREIVHNTTLETIVHNNTTNLHVTNVMQCEDIQTVRKEFLAQVERMESVKERNAKLLDRICELSHSVQVGARIRPPNDDELRNGTLVIDNAGRGAGEVYVLENTDSNNAARQCFALDHHWSYDTSQADVFADVESLVTSLVRRDVANGSEIRTRRRLSTILTCGDKGSGKTFTMFGAGEHIGLAFRAAHKLFETLTEAHSSGSYYEVTMSIFEVLDGKVVDLLVPSSSSSANLATAIQYDASTGEMRIPGLVIKTVKDASDGMVFMADALQRRNCHSSFFVDITVTVKGDEKMVSRLLLGDLAASSSDGNMVALEKVFAGNQVDFSQSVLTKVLRNSFSNDNASIDPKTVVIFTLAPCSLTLATTKQDLSRALALRRVTPSRSTSSTAVTVTSTTQQVETLEVELHEATTTITTLKQSCITTKGLAQEVIKKLNAGNTALVRHLEEERDLSRQLHSDLLLTQRNMKKAIQEVEEQRKCNEKLIKLVRTFEEERSANSSTFGAIALLASE